MKILLSRPAGRDLAEMKGLIAADDPRAAARVSARLQKAIDFLGQHPNAGRASEQFDFREWSVTGLPYVIPYRIRDEAIEILRVFHTSRQRPDNWS